jgi:hypothetical protein
VAGVESEPGTASRPRWIDGLIAHPVIVGVFVACIVLGAVLGATYLTDDWSLARRLAGGAVSGAGVALCVTATRIVG